MVGVPTHSAPDTGGVAFTVYAPPGMGVEALEAHVSKLESSVRLIAPEAEVRLSTRALTKS